ncbi:MAG: tetratricopeptide repeat protein, partial [Victivallales bacterium]|nr:tetratricopeptide repeat protein [Victivallales bacterium]
MKIVKFNIRLVLISIFPMILAGCSSPEEEAKDRQAKGVELYDQGEFAKAELELKNAIQQDNNAADSYYYLALLNEKGRNFKAMKENLTQAVKLTPDNIDARLKLGKVLLLFDDKEGALSQVDEILKIDPAHLDALALKAAVLVRD